ncbi:Phosphatidyl-myo-inositol mannosyltransferase [uncultured bacterium]|nr:Phosphatidyl-myo-inositol mannosyltransferase [uncultured bacterium]
MGKSVSVRKVAFVTDFYPEVHARWSGAEIACQRLRSLLAEDGIEVGVYTARAEFPGKKPPFVEDVRLLEDISATIGSSLKTLFPFDLLAYGFFLKRFREQAPDIVHLHNLKFMSFAPLAAARKLGIPAVFSVYDNWAICPRYCLVNGRGEVCEEFHGLRCVGCVPLKKKPFVAFRRPVFGRFTGKLDALAVLTGSERERYVKSGVNAEKLHILPLPLFEEGEDSSVDPLAVKRETILFVGRLEHGKGLHVLVEAMPRVLKRFPNVRVRVVGEHSGSDSYKKAALLMIKELGLESVFRFNGKMSNKEIRELLLKSHVVAAPEQWAIAWPIFLTEAMSMGKRIVASKIGDIPEFIREGETGFLAAHDSHEEFAAKIISALQAPEPVNKEASRVIMELCDRAAIKKRLLAIYESAMKKCHP